ncbi:MAG: HAD-IA family hydrolase [Anaerolineae bacterium]|nr:HAD-IA family hydrolase [Anaerolineae bacterium]
MSYFQGDWDTTMMLAIKKLSTLLHEKRYVSSYDDFAQKFSKALKDYYISRDIDNIEVTTSVLLDELLITEYALSLASSEINEALDQFYSVTGSHWFVDEFALETLEILKNMGFQLGLISNASHAPDVYQQLSNHGLRPLLEHVVISAEFGYRKPHPAIFHHALDLFSRQPDEAVMIGDTLSADIIGSRRAGIKNVWIRRWAAPSSIHTHDDGITPDKTIQYLFELPSLLEWWSSAVD